MAHTSRSYASAFARVLLWTASIVAVSAAHAAEPQWPDRTVSLRAQEQPLGEFLRELFRAAGMRALPSDSVDGHISGVFSDRPEKIFNDLVKAYDLLPYSTARSCTSLRRAKCRASRSVHRRATWIASRAH